MRLPTEQKKKMKNDKILMKGKHLSPHIDKLHKSEL